MGKKVLLYKLLCPIRLVVSRVMWGMNIVFLLDILEWVKVTCSIEREG